MKKFITLLVCFLTVLCLVTSCQDDKNQNGSKKKVVVGTMIQPGSPILKFIEDEFEAKGYKLEIKLFTDFSMPNIALAEGSIDANLFQHTPFLNTYNEANGTNLVSVLEYYDCVYGGYTKKGITSVDEIPNGSTITIANDASNMSRCLFILEASGLIEIKDGVTLATMEDITSNPKNLKIVPMNTNMIASSLEDKNTYLGLVNATFAIAAGLSSNELVCQEQDPEHINANIVAVQAKDKDDQWVKDLIEVLTSEKTKKFIEEEFKGTIIPYCKEVE